MRKQGRLPRKNRKIYQVESDYYAVYLKLRASGNTVERAIEKLSKNFSEVAKEVGYSINSDTRNLGEDRVRQILARKNKMIRGLRRGFKGEPGFALSQEDEKALRIRLAELPLPTSKQKSICKTDFRDGCRAAFRESKK